MTVANTLIVITGSIASGKSTIARKAAAHLRTAGNRTAVIDIDLVYEMLADNPKSDEQTWRLTHTMAGHLTAMFFEQGIRFVAVDGEFWTAQSRGDLAGAIPSGTATSFVTLKVSFTEALRRAQAEPSRGISKDPVFLKPHMDAFAAILPEFAATDTILDTQAASPEDLASRIADLVFSGVKSNP